MGWDGKRKGRALGPGLEKIKLVAGLDLNQRPPGYEPDELPGSSTPRKDITRLAALPQPHPRHTLDTTVKDCKSPPQTYLSTLLVGTSGRVSPTNPLRLGIFTVGSVAAFNSIFSSMIPFKYRMNAVTA